MAGKYPLLSDFENTGYVFWLDFSRMAGKYPLVGDFKNTGDLWSYFIRWIRTRVSSILEIKVYWISSYRNSSLKPEIHIHYLKNPRILDRALICVCMFLQKTIQYVPDYEILDILAPYAKMINDVNNIHYSIIRQLLDSTIVFHLFHPICQWIFPGRAQ